MANINGTTNDDTLKGGAGNDIVRGLAGNDLASMGAGDDVFIWNAGDGDDTVQGGAGFDTLRFTASAAGRFELTADGPWARLADAFNLGFVDTNNVERIDLRARGGGDEIWIDDLSGTAVKQVAIDLAGATPGVPDGVNDQVEVNGADSNETITVALAGGRISITGFAAQVTVANAGSTDHLWVDGGGGDDVIDASKLAAGLVRLGLYGEEGNDRITGSVGNEYLDGGHGNDTIIGGRGNDTLYGGGGNDLFVWAAGDGADEVEGVQGTDTLRVTGSKSNESLTISASSGDIAFARNGLQQVIAADVERLEIRALAGVDTVTINNLAGTDVQRIAIDLAATAGGTLADSSIDKVEVLGTAANDIVDISWTGSSVRVAGLPPEIDIAHAGAKDVLTVTGGNGNDILNAASLPAGKLSLALLGEAGDDTIFGSAGNDVVIGGVGIDLAYLGAGNDQFVWNVGDGNDRVEGQSGTDTLVVKGSAGAEVFDINNYNQAEFSSGLEIVTLNDVERVRLSTYGGKDVVNIYQDGLAGSALKQVAVDLGLAGGAGDGQNDEVVVVGTDDSSQITIAMAGGVVSVSGLYAQVTVAHAEAQDILWIDGRLGDDVINAASMPASAMQLSLDGGVGNDTITGGAGNDQLDGSDGNDVLRGGAGADSLNGGIGVDNLAGGTGADALNGGDGDDVILGGRGNDELWGGTGSDSFRYTSVLDGHDLIQDFDGDATGGQDTFNLDALFDALGIANGARAGRVDIVDNGGTVDIFVNADGKSGNGFELHVATLNTMDQISIGQDVILS